MHVYFTWCVRSACVCAAPSDTELTNTLNTITPQQRREKETGGTSEVALSGVYMRVCAVRDVDVVTGS